LSHHHFGPGVAAFNAAHIAAAYFFGMNVGHNAKIGLEIKAYALKKNCYFILISTCCLVSG
jgi:hypothetical protein